MITLLHNCLQPWAPAELTSPGLSYAPGACFPSGLSEQFPITFGTVQLDNAYAHLAQSLQEVVCAQYGATLHLGLPATPLVRALVESVFDRINEKCTHRMAATTGSHPMDPVRESRKNQKRPPLITFQTVDEALSTILTERNVTGRTELGGATPLALFEYHCRNHFVRFASPMLITDWRMHLTTVECPLNWHAAGNRSPHVNFQYVRYKGPGLIRVAGQEKHIRLRFDRRDMRSVEAFTLAGEALGTLHAPRSWQRFPHTLATRQRIHNLVRAGKASARDPLAGYFRYLLTHKEEPSAALSLLRVYTDAIQDGASSVSVPDTTDVVVNEPALSKLRWQSSLANHRSES